MGHSFQASGQILKWKDEEVEGEREKKGRKEGGKEERQTNGKRVCHTTDRESDIKITKLD